MKEQIQFVRMLYKSLDSAIKLFLANDGNPRHGGNYMNKNHGKYAIKRKITMLRQELLNLERMIDNG